MRRNSRESQRDLNRTAHHEAGHAVIASVYGFHPYRATMMPAGHFRGEVRFKDSNVELLIPHRLAGRMVYGLAGTAAQERYSRTQEAYLRGGQKDLEEFEDDWYKLYALTDGKCGRHDDFFSLTYLAVKQYWYAIQDFAVLLHKRQTIEGDELSEALDDVISTSENKSPPPLDHVCRLHCGELPLENFGYLEARGKALRAQAESEARSYELCARAELQARIKALRAGTKLEPPGCQRGQPTKLAGFAIASGGWWFTQPLFSRIKRSRPRR